MMLGKIGNHLVLVVVGLCVAASCSACSSKNAETSQNIEENSQESPKIDDEIWSELKKSEVSFVRMHPGAAQKNSYLTWRLFRSAKDGREQWRVDGKVLSPEGVADLLALLDEAEKVSMTSDGIYGCNVTESMPQYRLSFERHGHSYRIVSVSNCANGAPFNVIVDGAYRVDITGSLGTKLEKALKSAGLPLDVGGNPGIIKLDAPTPLAGYEARAQASPLEFFDQTVRRDAEFSSFYTRITEFLDEVPEKQLACNQAKSADCSVLEGRYVFKSQKIRYPVRMSLSSGGVEPEFSLPSAEDIDSLRSFASSPLFEQYATTGEGRVSALFKNAAQCPFVRDLAPIMERPNDVSCAQWVLGGKPRPSAIYYVGLSTLWIAPSNSKDFLSVVCQWKRLPKRSKSIACSEPVLPESLNVFWCGDGTLYGFDTSNGKTKLLK